jgi:DNA repair protein RecO (recombination protein O)
VDLRTTGIILRTRLLTETSLIVHWLTPDLGRLATVAKGARRAKSPFRGKLDLFYRADVSFARSARSELHNLREVLVRGTHPALRTDYARLRQAAYAAALVEQTTETETPLPEVFALLSGLLDQLDLHAPSAGNIFAFELKLLHELGQAPDVADARLSPGTRQIAARLRDADWPAVHCLKPSAAQVEELKRFLNHFMVQHLGKVPRGRAEVL